ncbi:hypothetical protein K505DRAFT_370778 [Melanomma pulvis-pyrius CBS 109.77]|uniref:Heterokaryon incompatibility domain-containing protein n=1 Tax=Melanomma pulvis-pyrius CBS 109.77 TaxID=1314802 RepID=A0A6A6XT30_9PLEO|nr:hypothetical protein K505DRAFT_370778 [Melanomma pulvis-pyrius CBS 109.77]
MDNIFKEALARRRNKEYVLTSTFTNAVYYGSPAWARKKSIWPPISRDSGLVISHGGVDEFPSCAPAGINQLVATGAPTPSEVQLSEELRRNLSRLTFGQDVLYHPLHDGETIRILELHAGNVDDPITCSFHYANLHHLHMKYEALSYVWGEKREVSYSEDTKKWETKFHTVQCNGYDREITPNLYRALRHTRSPSEPIFLWADALCINQDDARERGHQVTLMGAVYRSARRVLIWIGEQNKSSVYDKTTGKIREPPALFEDVRAQRSFGAICDIVNRWQGADSGTPPAIYNLSTTSQSNEPNSFNTFEEHPSAARDYEDSDFMCKVMEDQYVTKHARKKNQWCRGDDDEIETQQPDLGIDATPETAPDSQFWMSIDDLFNHSWFWRVWVVQEAVLAKTAVVKWANAEIDWRWIGLAAAILRTNYNSICEGMRIGGVYNAYLMFRMSPMSDLPPPQLSFTHLLRLTRQFEVTDSRDRIYGLLGMKTAGNDPETNSLFLVPDYTLSAAELWRQVAWKAIRDTGNLSILSSVQYTTHEYESERAVRKPDLGSTQKATNATSSWVPHWDLVYRTTLAPWDASDAFAAAKGFPLKLLHTTDTAPSVLRVQGIQAGTVGYAGILMWHDVDTSLLVSKHLGPFFASESGLRILCRIFTAGRNSYGSLTESSDEALFDFAAYVLLLHNRADTKGDRDGEDIYHLGLLNDRAYEPRETKSFQKVFTLRPKLKKMLEMWAQSGDAARFRQSAVAICERRRLFLTLNGFIGLGPDSVREGDDVTVLSGGDVPFLLRPITDLESSPEVENTSLPVELPSLGQRHLLVGECYVEGLMHGEAIEALSRKSDLKGPVPHELILQEIISYGNQRENVPSFAPIVEIERIERKKRRLQQGQAFTIDVLKQHTRVTPEKKIFHIW